MLANGGGIHVGDDSVGHDRQLSDQRQRRHRQRSERRAGRLRRRSHRRVELTRPAQQHRETTTARTCSSLRPLTPARAAPRSRSTAARRSATRASPTTAQPLPPWRGRQTPPARSSPSTKPSSPCSSKTASSATTASPRSATRRPRHRQRRGLTNQGALELRNTRIDQNSGTATGAAGAAEGGGIWNGALIPFSDGPPVELTLRNSTVTDNVLSGSLWNHHPWRRALHELPRHTRQQQNHRQRARSVLRMLKALHRH